MTGTLRVLEQLDEAECLWLISPGGIGRLAYLGRYGLTAPRTTWPQKPSRPQSLTPAWSRGRAERGNTPSGSPSRESPAAFSAKPSRTR